MRKHSLLFCLFYLVLSFSGCSSGPQPINYGQDGCALCKMIIIDHHFGAELITSKGKIYKFDSIECMIRYMKSSAASETKFDRMLVTDHSQPGQLQDANISSFLISPGLPSPMGESLSAFMSKDSLQAYLERFGGKTFTWEEIQQAIR